MKRLITAFITGLALVSVMPLLMIIFCSSARAASNVALGDSWLSAQTFNLNSVADYQWYTGRGPLLNFAVNSRTSAQVLSGLQTYYNNGGYFSDPTVVFIDSGLPDFFLGISKTTVQNNLIAVINLLRYHNDAQVVLSCPADASSATDIANKIASGTLKAATAMCETIRLSNPNYIKVVDLQSKLLPVPTFQKGDNVHLNLAGMGEFNRAMSNVWRVWWGYSANTYPVCHFAECLD